MAALGRGCVETHFCRVSEWHSAAQSVFEWLRLFLEHGRTQGIWEPIYAALQLKIKP